MWNQRFAGDTYFYGTEPNDFLAQHINKLTGKVLSLAEGEGRNAVFMAQKGLTVWAVDSSSVGLEKANALAKKGYTDLMVDGAPSPHQSDTTLRWLIDRLRS